MVTRPVEDTASQPRVVVVADSIEGIDALARLINQLPAAFPVPVVAHLYGLRSRPIERLAGRKRRVASRLEVVRARNGNHVRAGRIYLVPAEESLVFTAIGALGRATRATLKGAWVRPRHDGYMPFQHAASLRLNEALATGRPARDTVRELNAMFRESLGA